MMVIYKVRWYPGSMVKTIDILQLSKLLKSDTLLKKVWRATINTFNHRKDYVYERQSLFVVLGFDNVKAVSPIV